jgi:uncharacterized protein
MRPDFASSERDGPRLHRPGPKSVRSAAAALLVLLLVSVSAFAQSLPDLTAPVNDFAGVIGPNEKAALDLRIRSLQATTGDVVVVATVKTLAPYGSIEEYALKLFEKAGIGQTEKHNGALVVLALDERRVRIEVGYGLEEFITDGFAGETIRQTMLPSFRQGDYGAGLLAGTTRVIQRIAEGRGVTLQDVPAPVQANRQPSGGLGFIIPLIIIFFVISSLRRAGRRSSRFRGGGPFFPGGWSGWSGGGGPFGGGGFGGGFGGGGFGGFGGGRSGGGGASGGW